MSRKNVIINNSLKAHNEPLPIKNKKEFVTLINTNTQSVLYALL